MGNEELTGNGEAYRALSLDELPEHLGLPELNASLRGEIIEAMAAGDDIKLPITQYQELIEEFIDEQQDAERSKAHLGFLISFANLKHAAALQTLDDKRRKELLFDYKDRLKNALKEANHIVDTHQLPLEAVSKLIDKEIDRIFEMVGRRPAAEQTEEFE